ncbi:WGR domain-containing protein [Campylobacter sp. JMF_01 NE2]|uniref:WGR domain-containing protein n=1 Tax=unclassified Campylobacter TaxID=2593542 RepID=UPI0022EA0894|nr:MULTISPECIES: WGR domain-containing protein [unclassified Campylobacter]MDA3053190.1 WGR domain-containing protein [Campylobacter sp. JMF_03 NE3]MDA3067627.1 WGR domain-containing protein [Campylobacter sp. JMF_01 NE2]
MKTKLFKNTRYYLIELSKTLFGEFELRRIYGNVNYKSKTGERVAYFSDKNLAIKAYDLILKQKIKRGYM